jgi:hypothetical protein
MVNRIRAAGDRMLGALLPKATAQAYYCWYNANYCGPGRPEKCCHYPENNNITYCWCV